MSNIAQISVEELKQRRDAGTAPFLLDVREPDEYKVSNLGGTLIPLGELPRRVSELSAAGVGKETELIVHCKLGGRSSQAAEFLIAAGYRNVKNLTGGIMAWAQKIDPAMPVK